MQTLTLNCTTPNNGIVLRNSTGGFYGAVIVNGQGASLANRGNIQLSNGTTLALANADLTLNNAELQIGQGQSNTVSAGDNMFVKSLSGSGYVVSDSLADSLTIGAFNGTGSFSGVIGNGSGTLTLTKIGAGPRPSRARTPTPAGRRSPAAPWY